MGVSAQRQEVHQVPEVSFPVPLGIEVNRQVHARQFAREALAFGVAHAAVGVKVQHLLVGGVGLRRVAFQQFEHAFRFGAAQHVAAPLAVHFRLRGKLRRAGDVELVVHDRVARRIFVHIGGAVADPLARHEDRQLHVVLDLAHLEGRGVAVPHQVVDQPRVVLHPLGALAVRYARRLDDGGVVAHVVDHPDETVVEHGNRLVEDLLERRDGGPPGFLPFRPEAVDLRPLLGAQLHP